jgi:hypothetical protein
MRLVGPLSLIVCYIWLILLGFGYSKSLGLPPAFLKKSGSYSLFYPKLNLNSHLEQQEVDSAEEVEHKYVPMKLDEEDLKENHMTSTVLLKEKLKVGFNQKEISFILPKLYSPYRLFKGEKYRLLFLNNHNLIFSRKAFPIGWKHYPLKFYSYSSADDRTNIIDIVSMHGTRKLKDFMVRVEIADDKEREDFHEIEEGYGDDGEIDKELKGQKNLDKSSSLKASTEIGDSTMLKATAYYSAKVKKEKASSIFLPVLRHLKDLFHENQRIFKIRKIQTEKLSKMTKFEDEKRKKLELDRIIHPEKYRKKTIDKKGLAGSELGRYTPSETTKARRQVKRGG